MNQSVLKALKIMDLFTEEKFELSLKEISERSNIPKPTAYRLLSALVEVGFLNKTKESEHDSKYQLGLKLLDLGQMVINKLEVRNIALPFMEKLRDDINEVIHLVIINQRQATYIEKVESTQALRLYTRVGKSAPLYIGSGPKLLLAYLSREEQERILYDVETISFPNGNQIKVSTLLEELVLIKNDGFAFSSGEQNPDTTGISYPILDYRNEVVAALTVSGLSSRFENENLDNIKNKTKETAEQISFKLGYKNY